LAFQNLFRKKKIEDALYSPDSEHHTLVKSLNVIDLSALGIAGIIGAGIFSTIGTAAYNGGPGVVFLFLFTAIACGFSAFCYAQFASIVPVSGSAYTYAYVSFGEIVAWIVGWDLLMEYAIGNIAVAISWSDYFTSLLKGFHIHIPEYFTMDFLSASRGHAQVSSLLAEGKKLVEIDSLLLDKFYAYANAPSFLGVKIIADLPALMITFCITALVYLGIKESKRASNLMVVFKLMILLVVLAIGGFYVHPDNWNPFAPNGISGILKGISAVFFAYIGFDAISTTAEECKNPQRDLPRAMIASLIICTILYILIALVLTGMVSYKELMVGDPLAYVFEKIGMNKISGIISLSAVVAMASVMLVFQIGQPRIWMSMSRDGLLGKIFGSIHPKHKTPWFSTIVTGLVVAIPALFMNLTEVTDLTSIGTLFAFVLVCAGILVIDPYGKSHDSKFKVPYLNARYYVTAIVLLLIASSFVLQKNPIENILKIADGEHFGDIIPSIIFLLIALVLIVISIYKQYSSIPVLGLLCNLYLMSELGFTNWSRFLIWLAIGLIIYFSYGYKHSKLSTVSPS